MAEIINWLIIYFDEKHFFLAPAGEFAMRQLRRFQHAKPMVV